MPSRDQTDDPEQGAEGEFVITSYSIHYTKLYDIEFHALANIDDNLYNDFYELNVNEQSGKTEIVEKIDFDGIKKEKGERNLCNFDMDIEYSVKIPKNLNFSVNTISGEIELLACEGTMNINSVSA